VYCRSPKLTSRHRHLMYAGFVPFGSPVLILQGSSPLRFSRSCTTRSTANPRRFCSTRPSTWCAASSAHTYLSRNGSTSGGTRSATLIHWTEPRADEQNWRINFFLFLCFAMFAPMLQLFYQHGWDRGLAFVGQSKPRLCSEDACLSQRHSPRLAWRTLSALSSTHSTGPNASGRASSTAGV